MNCDISFQNKNWLIIKTKDQWQLFFENILKILKDIPSEELSISLIEDKKMKLLNHQFRHQNKPTNVLSFPSLTPKICLGDVVLSLETIQNEASVQEKTFEHHLTHLFIHGVLHLLGYDHIKEEERSHMEQKEINILQKLGVKNPYVA